MCLNIWKHILDTRNPSYVKSFLQDCWWKNQYKEDNGFFLILKEHERNIMTEKVERYKDDTLSLIAREDSVWDWKQNEIKLISESRNQTETWIDIHYFWDRKINWQKYVTRVWIIFCNVLSVHRIRKMHTCIIQPILILIFILIFSF